MGACDQAAQTTRIKKGIHAGEHFDAETERVVVRADAAEAHDARAGIHQLFERHGSEDRVWRNVDLDRPCPEAALTFDPADARVHQMDLLDVQRVTHVQAAQAWPDRGGYVSLDEGLVDADLDLPSALRDDLNRVRNERPRVRLL